MDSKVTPLDQIKECLDFGQNFVLQGGAGSGKTETLKQVLEFISSKYPAKKIACITHTNLAVDEIKSRVRGDYTISTIHSFLNDLIKDYKKNIITVIYEIFKISRIERKEDKFYHDTTEQNKAEHENYKKLHARYSSALFTMKKESETKVENKREYDKDPIKYNTILNAKIDSLNAATLIKIENKDYSTIRYNESRFDDFEELSFGHDSLIEVSFHLFKKYELLGRVLQDKFDFIFIDEYQDANEKIINIFLNIIPNTKKTIIGLFGDSMQSIYEDGIGDAEKYIKEGYLKKIIKEDNYRCSEEVIKFINGLRNDGLEQKVGLKLDRDGVAEDISKRKGYVKFYYSIYPKKPSLFSRTEEKQKYLDALNGLIENVSTEHTEFKKLMLTNKSISTEVGFKSLYETFDSRYLDAKEYIDKDLMKLQLLDLVELCTAYNKGPQNFNFILTELKKSGFSIKKIEDKVKIKEQFDSILKSDKSAIETLNIAFENKLLKKADKYSEYVAKKDAFLADLTNKGAFQEFKIEYNQGRNTYTRMLEIKPKLFEDEFKELEKLLKKEIFYTDLFSDKIKFSEILNYFEYINENTPYITMHKTKGSGIDNVLVVLDEFFWGKYNFNTIFEVDSDQEKRLKNLKLIYVACSRAKTNLICLRLITQEDEPLIKNFFPDAIKV
jgi:DNA helicase-2/ATP-dependent DNA helicase PcrA